APAAHGPVPLEERRLRRFRGFPEPAQSRPPQEHAPGAAPGARGGRGAALAGGRSDRAAPLGVLQPLLPHHLRGAPLEPVPQPGVLPPHWLEAASTPGDGARRARRPIHRLRSFPYRFENPLWSLLGRDRARAAAALRMLLLPADRVRDPPGPRGVRGRG